LRLSAAIKRIYDDDTLLLEHDLGRSLGKEDESAAVARNDGTHRLAHGVERVDLVNAFLRHVLTLRLVVLTEVQHEPEQSALRLVADLFRQLALVIRRLKHRRHQPMKLYKKRTVSRVGYGL